MSTSGTPLWGPPTISAESSDCPRSDQKAASFYFQVFNISCKHCLVIKSFLEPLLFFSPRPWLIPIKEKLPKNLGRYIRPAWEQEVRESWILRIWGMFLFLYRFISIPGLFLMPLTCAHPRFASRSQPTDKYPCLLHRNSLFCFTRSSTCKILGRTNISSSMIPNNHNLNVRFNLGKMSHPPEIQNYFVLNF